MSLARFIAGIQSDEEIVYALRRFWFALIPDFIGAFFIFAIPVGTYIYLSNAQPAFFQDPARFAMFLMGASLFFLYGWLFLFQNFADWYLDVWIVTNRRIVNIEQHGLFGRTTSELMLYNVQDVTSDIRGFFATMFSYGNISIQTAAEKEHFLFENVAHPNEIAKRILELTHDARLVEESHMGHAVTPEEMTGKEE
ncbi:MAG: PH domain-containing protein [Patescibacteria group bacterium]